MTVALKRKTEEEPFEPAELKRAQRDTYREAFFRDMRRYKVPTREEEAELFLAWKRTGDQRLRDQLVAANLRLVVAIGHPYHRAAHHSLLDLVQEGSIGLIHALTKYDPERGIRFTSYASYWIRAYMLKFMLANHHLVKLGTTQAQRKLFFNLRKTRALLEKDGVPATAEQIAEALEVDVESVVEMEMRLASAAASLDVPTVHDDGGIDSWELPAPDVWRPDIEVETDEARTDACRRIHTFGKTLSGRDLDIFEKRLVAVDPMTLVELAVEFGVTRERVRQIEERLKDRLKAYLQRTAGLE